MTTTARSFLPSRLFAVLLCLALVPVLIVGRTAKAFAAPLTVTVIIDSILQIDDPEDGFDDGSCWGDFEFTVNFGGQQTVSPEFSIDPVRSGPGCIVGQDTIPIGFSVTRTIDSSQVGAPLSISVKDIDVISDDTIDVSPVPGVNSLQLAVDPFTGTFAPVDASGSPQPGISFPGGVSAAQLSGNGDSDRGGLNMRIVSSAGPDSDGDGLLDSWETSGFDADGNGTIDVNLPAMGANPRHKDLFVELDTANGRTLGREDIRAMKDAFAAAPRTNPDGVDGITLHVDTGTAVDPSAREGQLLGTCNDGIDNRGDGVADAADGDCSAALGSSGNEYLDASVEDPLPPNCQNGVDDDGDGLPDATDPDCLAGDNLGGGNAITTAPAICNLNAAFYTTKLANFDPNRLPIFRYAISTPGSTGCDSGGQAEIGGNDFVDHNGDGGTIMHEMGHTLALRHGGFEDLNCKPNLVSVMSYFSQFGVGKNGGGAILDYSPPRQGVTGGARSSALPASVLDEASLSETSPVDGSDPANRFVFTNGVGTSKWVPLNGQTDWDGDGLITSAPVAVNIDNANSAGNPKNCKNTSTDELLRGADEWSQVSIPFRQNGDSANGAINPTPDDEPTRQELQSFYDALTTTDVGVTASAAPTPVAAGTTATVTASVTNHGTAPADATTLSFSKDARLTPTGLPANCTATSTGVTCAIGSLAAGHTATVAVPYLVAADAVFNAGAPITVPVNVSVSHVGPESNPADNTTSVPVPVVAVADLRLDALNVASAPPLLVIGQPAPLTLSAPVSSGGPSSPMDARVDLHGRRYRRDRDDRHHRGARAVATAPRTATGTVQLTCTQPGIRTLLVAASIAPTHAADTDPVAANNAKLIPLTIECLTPVAYNIRPGSTANEINLASGVVLTVVVTSSPGEYGLPLPFDATKVDPSERAVRHARARLVGERHGREGRSRPPDPQHGPGRGAPRQRHRHGAALRSPPRRHHVARHRGVRARPLHRARRHQPRLPRLRQDHRRAEQSQRVLVVVPGRPRIGSTLFAPERALQGRLRFTQSKVERGRQSSGNRCRRRVRPRTSEECATRPARRLRSGDTGTSWLSSPTRSSRAAPFGAAGPSRVRRRRVPGRNRRSRDGPSPRVARCHCGGARRRSRRRSPPSTGSDHRVLRPNTRPAARCAADGNRG